MSAPQEPSLELQTDFWNRWNTEAREKLPIDPVSLRRAAFVLERLQRLLPPGGRREILEIGCGTGWLCEQLGAFGSVTGIDLADEVIQRARIRMPHARFLAGDFAVAPFSPASFDVVVTLETIAHVIDQRAFVARIHDLLRPEGILLLTTQNRFVMERRSTVMRQGVGQLRDWLTMRRVRALVRPYFEILEATTLVPAGDLGVLRLINSYKLNGLVQMVIPEATIARWKERLGLGQTLVVAARKLAPPR